MERFETRKRDLFAIKNIPENRNYLLDKLSDCNITDEGYGFKFEGDAGIYFLLPNSYACSFDKVKWFVMRARDLEKDFERVCLK